MSKTLEAFAISVVVVILIVATALGFLMGATHPLPWISIALLIGVAVLAKRMTANRFLTWRDEYSVGIAELDKDHKRLLNLINQLQTAAHYQTSVEYEKEAFSELVDYTKGHFQREEALMEHYDYPGLAAHREQHKEMIAKVNGLLEAYEKDRDATIEGAINFLQTWLLKHINGTDKEYGGFLNDKGVH